MSANPTGAPARAFAAASPPNPPPTMNTLGSRFEDIEADSRPANLVHRSSPWGKRLVRLRQFGKHRVHVMPGSLERYFQRIQLDPRLDKGTLGGGDRFGALLGANVEDFAACGEAR